MAKRKASGRRRAAPSSGGTGGSSGPSLGASIGDAELTVLRALWTHGPSGPGDLHERFLEEGTDWAYTTVQTLLHRLRTKGFVTRERRGVQQIYAAHVTHEELVERQMDELAQRMGEGRASSLVFQLVENQRLSKAELTRLRALLDVPAQGPGNDDDPPRRAKKKGKR